VPLYDFSCRACGHGFEAIVAVGTAPACESCGSEETERRFSPIAPPGRLGLRGTAARDDQAKRAEREGAQRERFKAERARKRQG
jgi:putative FmdB family regulatory protein